MKKLYDHRGHKQGDKKGSNEVLNDLHGPL
jgi:hypothetical protein